MSNVLGHNINWIGGPDAGITTIRTSRYYTVVKWVLVRIEDEQLVDENKDDT